MNENNKKTINKILLVIPIFIVIFYPILSLADFVLCVNECGYEDLIKMINAIIDWVIKVSVPLAALIFAYAGFLYMSTGVKDQKARARQIFKNVFIGFVLVLSAWLIVTTITNKLLNPDFKGSIPLEGVK